MTNDFSRQCKASALMRPSSFGTMQRISYASGPGDEAFRFGATRTESALSATPGASSGAADPVRSLRKRIMDFGFGGLAVVAASPILLAVAIAIKLESPGPVLFRQPRRGLHNRPFMVLKFRSMHQHLSDVNVEKQTSRNDPRVTRVGKWLRRLSLDELPQLFNVLRGEMSLVGPRPHAPNTRVEGELLDAASSDYLLRYNVKPGITGWAQVNGARGELVKREDLRKRIDFDLDYIRRWSPALDLKIMVLTAMREIISKNAF